MSASDLEAAGRRYLRCRRRRADLFGSDDLADLEWDMLVDLYLDRDRSERSITSACEASRLPLTTSLRWVRKLCEAKLIRRDPDPFDLRRSNLRLTAEGEERAKAWLIILSRRN